MSDKKSHLLPDTSLVKVGHVMGPKGLKGELRVKLYAGEATWLKKNFKINVQKAAAKDKTAQHSEWDGTATPMTVQGFTWQQDVLILKFNEVNDRNHSEALQGSSLFISQSHFKSKKGETFYLRELIGYEVIDQKLGALGRVLEFESNGPQDLIKVTLTSGDEILIPLIKEFIVEIKESDKKIIMNLPDGLVEANSHAL